MAKRPARPAKYRAPALPQARGGGPSGLDRNPLNRNLNRQTRKVLGKHYRAKYGVK
jgi:hypothetical protein